MFYRVPSQKAYHSGSVNASWWRVNPADLVTVPYFLSQRKRARGSAGAVNRTMRGRPQRNFA